MNTGKTNCMPRQQLADYDLPPMPALEQVSTMLLSSNRALPSPVTLKDGLKTERRGKGDDRGPYRAKLGTYRHYQTVKYFLSQREERWEKSHSLP